MFLTILWLFGLCLTFLIFVFMSLQFVIMARLGRLEEKFGMYVLVWVLFLILLVRLISLYSH